MVNGFRKKAASELTLLHFGADDFPKEPAHQETHDETDDGFHGQCECGVAVEKPSHGADNRAQDGKGDCRSEDHHLHQAFFVVRFLRAPKKWEYMRTWGWLDLLSAVPIPFFSIVRIVRVARVAVAVRKMRYKDVERSITRHPARSTLIATGFLALLVVVAGSALELQFEANAPQANIHSGGDALWWAMVSIATVGYGDKYPVTTAGRITAVFVIGVGVVLFGVISSYLASTFIASRDRVGEEAIIADLKGDLDTIKTEVADLKEGFGTIQAEMVEIKQLLQERNGAS